ncbi:MAG: glycosyltransferase family 4 protein [Lachnospiraceae bacterium]|nr:glycosyltransferase family 4 protein [Lachnospiraceae bacterium]
MKKVLFVATVFKFLNFEESDMNILKNMGYEIHTATNMQESEWLRDDGKLDYLQLQKHQINFGRNPFSRRNIMAYKQLKKLINHEKFELIHCHTPVAGTITRLAARKARKRGTKIVYTSHGFHFHKTSSKKNWILFYPIEFIMSYFTDMIITINKEDYHVIQKFKAKEKRYIPGVGVDVEHIANLKVNKNELRKEFNLPQDAFVVMSVGELSVRKNHEMIINAISKSNKKNIYYLICGTGDRRDYLERLAKEKNVSEKIIFAGQQPHEQILRLEHAIDLGALPSLIEGLGLAGIETLAAGKPMVASGIHGINDYVIDGQTGICCNPKNENEFCDAIEQMVDDRKYYMKCCKEAQKKAYEFDITKTRELMRANYKCLIKEDTYAME